MNFIHYVCPFENLIWLVISFSNFTEDIKIWFLIYKIHLNRYEMSLEAFFFQGLPLVKSSISQFLFDQ